jgi:hypothetical protein
MCYDGMRWYGLNNRAVEAVECLESVNMKMALKIKIAVWVPMVAVALMLCGCATISENTHAYIGSPQYAPVNKTNVQIYATEPKTPKDRLGEIILSIDGNASRQKVDEKLRKAAAKLGADGVYVASDRTHIQPVIYWDYWGPVREEDWVRLIVGVAFKNK